MAVCGGLTVVCVLRCWMVALPAWFEFPGVMFGGLLDLGFGLMATLVCVLV